MNEKLWLVVIACLSAFLLGIGFTTSVIPKQKEYIYLNRTVFEVQEVNHIKYIIQNDTNPTGTNNGSYINENIYPKFLDPTLVHLKVNQKTNTTILTINKLLVPFNLSCASYSMATWMGCGNMGIAEKTDDTTDFLIGDTIIFKNPFTGNGTTIHQIIKINDTCILTKGINNKKDDNDCVKKEDIYYRVLFMLPTNKSNINYG